MNAIQLRETTMDPNTRRLVQLDLDDAHLTAGLLDKLLAKNVQQIVSSGLSKRVTQLISRFKELKIPAQQAIFILITQQYAVFK